MRMIGKKEFSELDVVKLVPDDSRIELLPQYFGQYMMDVEQIIFDRMDRHIKEYKGGYFDFYEINPGPGEDLIPLMVWTKEGKINLENCNNYFEGETTPLIASMAISMLVYNHFSWQLAKIGRSKDDFENKDAKRFDKYYWDLRGWAYSGVLYGEDEIVIAGFTD